MNMFTDQWSRIRAWSLGASAIKNLKYIAAPNSWEADEKSQFVDAAYVFNATKRTIDGLSGMVGYKPAILDLPPEFSDLMNDLDGMGSPIDNIVNVLADALCGVGNIGLLVDYPQTDGQTTIAEATAKGLRPAIAFYEIESIIEVKHEKIGNKYILSRVRLAEKYIEPVAGNEFAQVEKDQVRVLDLVEGKYRVRIFRQGKFFSESFPYANGAPLNEIPFRLVTATGKIDKPCRPPLDDLAQVNIDHLNDSAWRQRALRFCGSPFYAIFGMNAPEGGYRIGSSSALFCPDADGSAQVVVAPAESVGALAEAMKEKRSDMAVIGARFLQQEASANIAENTATIHRSGDNASLSSISASIEQGLTASLKWCALFMGISPEGIKVTLSRDYMPRKMAPQELTALVGAWQSGGMTQADLYDNLVKGEIVQSREGGAEQFKEELAEEGVIDAPIANAA